MVTASKMSKIMNETNMYCFDIKGLSTDEKPDSIDGYGVAVNSLFLELDTGDFYYFTGSDWVKVGEEPESQSK